MVRAPPHVYSALVKNLTSKEVKVKAFYAVPDAADEEVNLTIKPGETAKLEQKIVQATTFSMTAHIRRVEADGSFLETPFTGVLSPVQEYKLEIHEADGACHLKGSL
ncbi:uncharacterized protein TEOVI_000697200 [Trypanosoma equiperdum]|uniref:Uncharacterized protein n=4 Tax=Trypanozoon TaxID=39700 RepID=Q586A0_TRYB2|nr:hypothetical protein, conserved [Trypanosoma brucei gambiense DAL972]XP_845520.1 hypothetical protein, conserved [Trypanosoma brucei brucei TREU927]AAX80753.1 hypothetical protein, conserved [Trypanosoma brucei]RHW71927.1 hypothetical protein DPX39_060044500 [Trypanosoma brucei equiperdum]SCU68598.1 hypothetical protein, conserved [Trypanosoma equiperdum]AAZ11961.1 hypothetical protein, conserved [Trypanosoma brucei brucei TREU927]CBH11902.1 hypothetical protein, conserved [Trypanosoma bru|eukprot:XP_011774187.1 hypothetical protein, conserved [Trypanosoma brucei gambiense DAL972]